MQQAEANKRYNKLLREEETEVAYWQDMQNTNRSGSQKQSADDWKKELAQAEQMLLEEAGGGAAVKGPQHSQGQQGGSQRGQSAGGGRGDGRKPTGVDVKPKAMPAARPKTSSVQATQRHPQHQQSQGEKGDGGKAEKGPPAAEPTPAPAGGDGKSADHEKKPRTKTHDKHHQRDKALKKTAHFNPF